MADSLEQRPSDVERMLAHIPEDLDARFAGVDVKLAELRELVLLQSSRFTKLDARLNDMVHKVGTLDAKMDTLDAKVDERFGTLDAKLDAVLQRLPPKP